ncbi:MAG TPA: tannase/feruloyl esterase family alpha/beta hydrolase [Verrucomicrobia subdivision 3 bacterium]|nr:tannase/feruloyl esterase family alpha/beta hydrolase [Limisphaerales bacterium]
MLLALPIALAAADAIPAPGTKLPAVTADRVITAADVTVEKVGTSIPADAIGEPVGGVTLSPPRWVEATGNSVAYATVDGSIAPKNPKGKPINFRVLLPANWSRQAIQMGGSGINGVVPMMRGDRPGSLTAGFARYGSDSGHQMGGFGGPGAGRGGGGDNWALNEEAMRNLGYLQMKKTHDAAMVIMERVYGERPRFNYYIGASQGGREALTVAQRYPADYDGIVADVPIVSLSTLMLAPELIRIQEKQQSNWVTRAKVNAIRAEFMRQADKLDGLADGVINNYMAARALFDMSQGDSKRNPWAALRAPDGVDPNPADPSANARLTDGQIETLKFVYSRYPFATPLANGVRSFGMWVPNTDPAGSGLIADRRFRGQEGAGDNAPMHGHLGILGVTGFLMQNLSANPLDYAEGGPLNPWREEISQWFDSSNPDLFAFYKRGGKMIVTIGTDDTLASPGAQMDYFQSVLDKLGREQVDAFARFFVIPQTGHGLSGRSSGTTGDGQSVPTFQVPNQYDKTALITAWVERNEAPGKTLVVTAGGRSLPLCSYPNYPLYKGGPPESAASYETTAP